MIVWVGSSDVRSGWLIVLGNEAIDGRLQIEDGMHGMPCRLTVEAEVSATTLSTGTD